MFWRPFAIVLAVCMAAGVGVAGQARHPAGVVIVPMGTVPVDMIERVSRRVGRRWSIPIEVRRPVALDPALVDGRRRQVVAERALTWLEARFAHEASSQVVIGVMADDLYSAERSWRFTFSIRKRRPAAPGLAIMSSARMSEAFYGLPDDRALLESRLGKMLTKNLGVLYFGMPLSDDPTSVMYRNLLSLDDLDRMGDELRPVQRSTP